MNTVTVGIVGAGYASHLHCSGYRKVHGASVRLKTICDVDTGRAEKMASSHGIEETCGDFRALLEDKEIDLIDICTPPNLHAHMIKDALSAGKHVICEKPLTGYFGTDGDPQPIGKAVSKRKMYAGLQEWYDFGNWSICCSSYCNGWYDVCTWRTDYMASIINDWECGDRNACSQNECECIGHPI